MLNLRTLRHPAQGEFPKFSGSPLTEGVRPLHAPLLRNWFRSGEVHSSDAMEGLGGKTELAPRNAYG